MTLYDLTDLARLDVHAADAEAVTWGGRPTLRLVNGLVIFPDLDLTDATFEVRLTPDRLRRNQRDAAIRTAGPTGQVRILGWHGHPGCERPAPSDQKRPAPCARRHHLRNSRLSI